jgi:hypothetical protein
MITVWAKQPIKIYIWIATVATIKILMVIFWASISILTKIRLH